MEHADPQVYCSWWCGTRPKKGRENIIISDDFGHWLAGLIDGEGCFTILYSYPTKHTKQSYYMPRFSIGFRDDDEAMVQTIKDTLQLGIVLHRERSNASKPQVQLDLTSIADQLLLIHVLDTYPLRSKKRKAYEIWRQAVIAKAGPTRPPVDLLARLRDEIREANAYHEKRGA